MSLKPDQPDDRDHILASGAACMPASADLRLFAGRIEDQLATNSCTANAGCSAAELYASRAGVLADFSRLFLYFNERQGTRFQGRDDGATLRDCCASLARDGVCLEEEWPFHPALVNTQPTASCYQTAQSYRVGQYARVPDLATVKTALAMGYPVIFSAYFYPGFQALRGDAALQRAALAGYPSGQALGSHAMLVVGYDDNAGHVIVENSWGEGWGENGYGYLPYPIFEQTTHDMWVFTEFAGLKPAPMFDIPQPPLAVTVGGRQAFQNTGAAEQWAAWRINVAGGVAPFTYRTATDSAAVAVDDNDSDQPSLVVRWAEVEDPQAMVTTTVTDSSLIPQTVTIERRITLAKAAQVTPVAESDGGSRSYLIFAVAAFLLFLLITVANKGA